MAGKTIPELDPKATPGAGDYLILWDAGGTTTKKLDSQYYEPADSSILKTSDFGTGAGDVAEGNHSHQVANLGSSGATANQVPVANGSGGISWADQEGGPGGTGGHAIEDEGFVEETRGTLNFTGASVSVLDQGAVADQLD